MNDGEWEQRALAAQADLEQSTKRLHDMADLAHADHERLLAGLAQIQVGLAAITKIVAELIGPRQ